MKEILKAFFISLVCIPVAWLISFLLSTLVFTLPFIAIVRPSRILDASSKPDENKKLRGLLTETWRLIDRATLIFGKDHNLEYYESWERYRELERKCEPFLGFLFDIGPDSKELKQSDCRHKAENFQGGIVELNDFLECGKCDYLDQCLVPQYFMENL